MKTKIYCCYHEPSQVIHDGNEWFYGKKGLLNPFINEMSMFLYVWQEDIDSDFIGTCHYRRRILSNEVDVSKLDDESVYCYEVSKSKKPEENGLKGWCHAMMCDYLFDEFIEFASLKYKGYVEKEREIRETGIKDGGYFIMRNSFVMSRKLFMGMCDFLFSFVGFHDRKHNMGFNEENYKREAKAWWSKAKGKTYYNLTDKEQYRILGYFLERLASFYLNVHCKRIIG